LFGLRFSEVIAAIVWAAFFYFGERAKSFPEKTRIQQEFTELFEKNG
jgi:hypothetical protein